MVDMTMHPSSNNNTSNNLYDPSRALENYYCSSSPSLFPTSPSLHHQHLHGVGDNNGEADFFQDFLENHHEMIQKQQNPLEKYSSNINNIDFTNKRKGVSGPGKKILKKDRHTKIETAQGPRDRRMRLSLNIARRFFDLQDMLGFDKASKTVEWLLTKSISAITELSTSFQQQVSANISLSASSSTTTTNNGKLEKDVSNNNKNCKPKKPNNKVVRTIHPLSKKSREKARERARERTKEKIIMSNLQRSRELGGTTHVVGQRTSLLQPPSWIPSSTILNLQENHGVIHGVVSSNMYLEILMKPACGN